MIIKWKNRFSQEEGYVKSVVASKKHFVNTFDRSEAKNYKDTSVAKSIITKLISYGEGDNNDFYIEE